MIRLGYNKINKMDYADIPINKAYYGDALIFQSFYEPQKPCFAVVDDISSYQERKYDHVFNEKDGKWYMLNNIKEYEQYGLYGEGLDITYYKGKLTEDNGIEYEWDGNKWAEVGEMKIETNLPDVPFTINYNAKNYDEGTSTIRKTEGQLNGIDAVITSDKPIGYDGEKITINFGDNARAVINGDDISYFNRDNSNPNITIISKAKGSPGPYILSNRNQEGNGVHNWMYRQYSTYLTMHFSSTIGQISCSSTEPSILSVRVDTDRNITYNNWSEGTTVMGSSLANYGGQTISGAVLFQGYSDYDGEKFYGDFYWIYMSQNTLTDEQVKQVIDINEKGYITVVTVEYEDMPDPENNIVFDSMRDALKYKCPWIGMKVKIGGEGYIYTEEGWTPRMKNYQVDLKDQWQPSKSYGDITDIDNYVFYESFSNYHIPYGQSSMIITIYGYNTFTFKVRNWSENNYDYVVVNNLDDLSLPKWQPSQGDGLASNGKVYYTNKGKASATDWYDVTFENLDGEEHKIMVTYAKDSGGDNNNDRGYVAIPINQ